MVCRHIFAVLLFLAPVYCIEELSEWARLYDYEDFSTTTLFYHTVPDLATASTWSFQVDNIYPNSCENKNVTIVLQHSSLPVIEPLRKVTPKNFYVEKSPASRVILHIISNNVTIESTLKNPKPGSWYTVAYLPPHSGELLPGDLHVKCEYRMRSWFKVQTLPSVGTVDIKDTTSVKLSGKQRLLVKFFVPISVHGFVIKISDCSHGNASGCDMTLKSSGQSLPGPKSLTISKLCTSDSADCELEHFHPEVNSWQYVEIQSNIDDDLEASLSFTLKECTSKEVHVPSAYCQLSPLLDRFRYNTKFKNKFGAVNGSRFNDVRVNLAENQSQIIPFQLKDGEDTGGSLSLDLKLDQSITGEGQNVDVKVNICLQRNVIPVNVDILLCENGYQGYLSNSKNQGQPSVRVIIPYPEATIWALGLIMQCYKPLADNISEPEFLPCGKLSVGVKVNITTDACVDGECNSHGRCINYLNGQILYTTCRCNTGWRGFDCSNGSEVRGHTEQLVELLLLTISNIFFLPAIFLSLYRRHFVEALVYAYTMVFSALYHACDGKRMDGYTYCVLPFHEIGIVDYVATATSIWITLVAMSRPPLQWKGFAQIFGPLAILVGVLYRKTSAFTYVIPAIVGLLLVLISWMCRCCYRHRCYPSKKKYLLCLLPGIVLCVGGIAIFMFLQTKESYMYTHSAWHVCISVCVIFLLPPRETRGIYKIKDKNGTSASSTYQPIATNRSSTNNYVM